MKIIVSENTKQLLAKLGPNKLFGDDVDQRKKLSNIDAELLFDRVWKNTLEHEVRAGDQCDSNDAKSRLTPTQQQYFDSTQEHRSFRMQALNAEFIAQLYCHSIDEYEMTQLWRVSSSDTHPKTLFVTFATVEEREKFRKLATNLGIKDDDLGLQLILDFMKKHPGRFLTNRV